MINVTENQFTNNLFFNNILTHLFIHSFVHLLSCIILSTVTAFMNSLISSIFPCLFYTVLGKGALYRYDAVGSYERVRAVCAGRGEKLIQPLLDELTDMEKVSFYGFILTVKNDFLLCIL